MAEDGEIDVLGDFDLKLQAESDIYDANELPSKSANLLPEYTHPPWMLEQGWTLDGCMDEKSKATIEKMLLEEQYYLGGKPTRSKPRRSLLVKEHLACSPTGAVASGRPGAKMAVKRTWTDAEKQMLLRGMEIYGKCWTKIAELIPTRTILQIKSYAHHNRNAKDEKVSETKRSATSSNTEPKLESEPDEVTEEQDNPIIETITRVTTAQPTVAIRQVILPKKGRIPKVDKQGAKATKRKSPVKNQKSNKCKHKNSKLPIASGKLLHSASKRKGCFKKNSNFASANSLKCSVNNVPGSFFQQKMSVSPGLIENLEGFCAVADIMSSGTDDGLDEDIDIENDDETCENPILQNRSTSPNSVYEKLVLEANLETLIAVNDCEESAPTEETYDMVDNSGRVVDNGVAVSEDVCPLGTEKEGESKGPLSVAESSKIDSNETEERGIDREETDEKLESGNDVAEAKKQSMHDKVLVNTVITCDGDVVHYPVPQSEKSLQPGGISEDEKQVHSDFFENNRSSTKTPQRYLKIRNYIIESWNKCKPNYLNKTSVRPGLKNCGDVNCIGRVHSFLESIGVINFGCDQASYRQPRNIFPPIREMSNGQSHMFSAKKDSMRSRKRKVKDAFGVWVDEMDLQGKTIEHPDGPVDTKPSKQPCSKQTVYDPFKLIPCLSFTADNPAPFQVKIHNAALIVMDIHSHISKTEVIGMLGGRYCMDQGRLTITMATPCNSISTGMQCEMDPVSQTQASEEICSAGMDIVGWYHSHPTFAPNPSVRDIETQLKFQEWFSKGGSNFVGIIVSPYHHTTAGLGSEVNCLTVSEDVLPQLHCNIPYKFDYTTRACDGREINHLILTAQDLATSYSTYQSRVDLLSHYSPAGRLTCLQKMLESIKLHYPSPDTYGLLKSIHDAFTNSDIEPGDSLGHMSQPSKDSPVSETLSGNS